MVAQQSKGSGWTLYAKPGTSGFRSCFGEIGISLAQIYGRASLCSNTFVTNKESWVVFVKIQVHGQVYVRWILRNVNCWNHMRSILCEEATCMHSWNTFRTALHARRACAHTIPLGKIFFLADCILVPAEVSFSHWSIFVLRGPNNLRNAPDKSGTLKYLALPQSRHNHLTVRREWYKTLLSHFSWKYLPNSPHW